MNWIEALFGIPEEMRRPGAVAAPPAPPANNVPRTVPIPATPPPRPPTGATLPGGSFTPSRMPANQVPIPQQRPMQQAGGVQVAPGASQEPPQAVSASQVGPMPAAPASPLQDILTGGQPTTLRDRFRAFAAGAGNIGNTGGDPFVAFGRGLGGASQYFDSRQEAEIKNAVALRKLKLQEGKGSVSYGKTPVWGTDPETGKAVLGVIGDDGSFKKVDTSGVDLSTGIDKIDAGTHWLLKDKRSGETVGMVPKENYQESFDKTKGTEDAKTAVEIPKLRSKAMSSMEQLETKQAIVTDTIDGAIAEIDGNPNMMTGLVGGVASAIPGTAAYDLARKLDTIKANVGFDQLQAMRDASPTGGALGQVSEMENRLLQSVLGSLDQAQSAEEISANLARLKATIETARQTRRDAFNRDFGGSDVSNGGGLSKGSEPASNVTDYTDYFGSE